MPNIVMVLVGGGSGRRAVLWEEFFAVLTLSGLLSFTD